MILYFSGTGNSEYVAKRISKQVNEKALNLFEKIRSHDFSNIHSPNPWIIVAPTYAWRLPSIVHEWLEKTSLSGSADIYFILTCGGSIGNSIKYLKSLCDFKNMNCLGCLPVVMPENYIAMFPTPTKEAALQTIYQAEGEIDRIANLIKSGNAAPEPSITIKDKINSSIINNLFYPTSVHAKKFYAKDNCISCGKCSAICPMNNIRIENGKPIWGKTCTHCMSCICRCPSEAIEYGNHSKGLPRYTCPKKEADT